MKNSIRVQSIHHLRTRHLKRAIHLVVFLVISFVLKAKTSQWVIITNCVLKNQMKSSSLNTHSFAPFFEHKPQYTNLYILLNHYLSWILHFPLITSDVPFMNHCMKLFPITLTLWLNDGETEMHCWKCLVFVYSNCFHWCSILHEMQSQYDKKSSYHWLLKMMIVFHQQGIHHLLCFHFITIKFWVPGSEQADSVTTTQFPVKCGDHRAMTSSQDVYCSHWLNPSQLFSALSFLICYVCAFLWLTLKD